ncbi:phage tail protein [Psychrobacter glaciei]|uniref:phage tail protein n=1 Tax=Psychrobacter glaciei TaxID=619771 RepID=UPI003F46491B
MALRNFTWCVNAGATQDTQLVTNSVKFGDGYEQLSSFGINNTRTSWQVAKTAYLAEIDAIYDFLIEHKGVTPFYLTINEVTKTYRTEGNINRAHVSGNVWQLSFNLKQVFIP